MSHIESQIATAVFVEDEKEDRNDCEDPPGGVHGWKVREDGDDENE